jgi:hypothetical protein
LLVELVGLVENEGRRWFRRPLLLGRAFSFVNLSMNAFLGGFADCSHFRKPLCRPALPVFQRHAQDENRTATGFQITKPQKTKQQNKKA